MSEHRRQALAYLKLPPGSPWKWEDGGRVLASADGTTIAFREEINAIIERLAGTALPAFEAIALLLAGCRGKLPTYVSSPSDRTPSSSRADFQELIQARSHQQAGLELSKLHELPADLIKSPRGKAFLAAAIFESQRSSSLPAREIAAGIGEDFSDEELNTPAQDAPPFNQTATTWAVVSGLQKHTAQSLIQRLKTGLDSLPKAAVAVSLPAAESARRLLSELPALNEYAGLAIVAREVMAAIRLPALAAETDEFALGGAAGLSTRGTLDRLLLSELAHDDDTLATRVALNEALYLHREPPVLKPERSLTLVLDSGLRMWGVPRAIAASAALALIAGHRGRGEVAIWRPEAEALSTVDLLSREGLQAHLAVLRTDLDPRHALPALTAMIASADDGDLVLITHRDALDDLSFQGRLASLSPDRGFLLLIDNNGLVQLHPLPWGAPRPLAQVQVQIDKLLEPPTSKAKTSLIDSSKSADLPAIFREPRFPLLLSANTKMEKSIRIAQGGMCVTSDRRLLRWERGPFGAEQLLTDLPGGRTCWLGETADCRQIIVKGRDGDGRMAVVVLDPKSTQPRITRFTGPKHASAVHLDQNVLLVILNTRVVAVSIDTSEVLAETEFPAGMSWISGRYSSPGTGVFFASWNGANVRWDDAISGRSLTRNQIVLAFERDGVGVWLLLRNGEIINPTGQKFMETGWPVAFAAAFPPGDVLVATSNSLRKDKVAQQHTVYLKTKVVVPQPTIKSLDSFEQVPFPSRPTQNRFTAIQAEPGQPLRLRKSKGGWLEIFASGKSLRFAESAADKNHLESTQRAFTALPAPISLGCSLQVADWPDGSRAWLDGRGFLHLRSHDPAILELTLTLNQGDMAAWTSDGKRCGIPFFAGRNQPIDASLAAGVLKSFCDRLC
jgi:hypothetical protein